ncbi:hypothetical protein LOK49_LG11G00330 [Camellia lanceoleosa]|uniref:Uncharacterized protein n=1 Tax=Camellia lanceoleosa TaxID=1840588 RepID=A0ACC0G3W1_9ERIC|nr:hypothetical protein LOK49_LG11G00330 [Camellia lanceoleosa]
MARCWEDSMPEEDDHNESSEVRVSGRATTARALSNLLQQGWLRLAQQMRERESIRAVGLGEDDDGMGRYATTAPTRRRYSQSLYATSLLYAVE